MSTTVQPERDNDKFTGVQDLSVNPLEILAAQQNAGLSSVQVSVGTITPTDAGNYPVVDSKGNTILFPPTVVVLSTHIAGAPELVGGTNIDVGSSPTDGGPIATSLLGAAQTTADINTGFTAGPPTNPVLGLSDLWLSAATTGTYTSGSATVVVTWINASG